VSRYRVVITGVGAVTPLGDDAPSLVAGLLAGRSGVGPITRFDAEGFSTRIAAQAPWSGGEGLRDCKIAFALEAARQAIEQASASGERPRGTGTLSLGIGLELFSMPDMAALHAGAELPGTLAERLTFLQTPSDLAVHLIAARYELRGPPRTHVSACAAGADAVGAAFRLVAQGRTRWALAGGADSMINPLGVAGFCKLRAMSRRNDDPAAASRPFDRGRDGFVLGEGAGLLVLERLEDARARGAVILAEVGGYANTFDAHGISEPHPEGEGAYRAMAGAVADAGLTPDDVDCVSAHGTSTPKNDPVETLAIRRLLGERAGDVPVVAPKSALGHLISAAGAVEIVAAVGCLGAQRLHPTLNLSDPDPACDLDYVAEGARDYEHRTVLCNSFGFGGQNACVLLKGWEGA
jgi:3-oxoacyl-[acyl-carrier-protein] synthase II